MNDWKERVINMVKKSWSMLILGVFILTILVFLSINQVSAVGETFVCAEKTLSGAWCQNVPANQVNTAINPITGQRYRQASTSCEATAFCKLGTCVNNRAGECRPNVPQVVCQESNGVWLPGKPDEIIQCQLGCCLLGDQGAFVTQNECKTLSSDYGIPSNFRSDIKSNEACLASANPDVKGACVIDDGIERKCKLLTQSECQKLESNSGSSEDTTIEFHEGLLCSAESLATNCGRSQKTTCVENKFEVYFLDTCGNLANIYDASKINNQEYWTNIKERDESCNPDEGNAGSTTCGSCDYTAVPGSTCKPFERGNKATPQPQYGSFVCADLSCEYQGKKYEHGETWCATSTGISQNLPGSQHGKFVCYNGEVTTELCDPFRGTLCIEDEVVPGFSSARCRANEWQECTSMDNKKDCENRDKRDCKWLEGQTLSLSGFRDDEGKPFVVNSEGQLVPKAEVSGDDDEKKGAACVPLYPPGFDFWAPESKATDICLLASDNCLVKFEKSLLGGLDWDCKENCECAGLRKGDPPNKFILEFSRNKWANDRNNMCVALGDCGNKSNYIEIKGYHSENPVVRTKNYEPEES